MPELDTVKDASISMLQFQCFNFYASISMLQLLCFNFNASVSMLQFQCFNFYASVSQHFIRCSSARIDADCALRKTSFVAAIIV